MELFKNKKNSRLFRIEIDHIIFFFFFFFIQNFFGQIYVSDDVILYNDSELTDNNIQYSEHSTRDTIYVSSASLIIEVEINSQYQTSLLSKQNKKSSNKHLTAKKVNKKTTAEKPLPKSTFKSEIYFVLSTHTFFAKSTAINVGAGPRTNSDNKIVFSFSKDILKISLFQTVLSSVHLYLDSYIFKYLIKSFSVRPPPLFFHKSFSA